MLFIPDKQQLILHFEFCSHLDIACLDLFTNILDLKSSCCYYTVSDRLLQIGEVQQCRSTTVPKKIRSTVPKMKTLFNIAKNLNKLEHIRCGNQKLNGDRLQS